MKHRLFVAVNLDEGAKKSVEKFVNELKARMPWEFSRNIRFAPAANWHPTLSFLGYHDDADIGAIMEAARKTANEFSALKISFVGAAYSPRKGRPRMIWLLTDKESERELAEIKSVLEDNLEDIGVRFRRETRPFTGHLTLARFGADISMDELPSIEERGISFGFQADSLDLMESELKRGGAEYTILQKFSLG